MIQPASSYNDDLRLAHVLADSVDDQTMSRFKALDLHVETKPDLTPVTDADKAAEEAIRGQLSRSRPRDAVLGEEFGSSGHGSRRWIIDPIDGTKNFVRGVPVWATLIALVDEGDRWWAWSAHRRWASGGGRPRAAGAYMGRSLAAATRLQVSDVSSLSDASLSYSSLGGWKERGNLDDFLGLTEDVWRTRAYGDFWSYCMVAEGSVDIACEPELNLYDMAALVPDRGGGRRPLHLARGRGRPLRRQRTGHQFHPALGSPQTAQPRTWTTCSKRPHYRINRPRAPPYQGRPPSYLRTISPFAGRRVTNPLTFAPGFRPGALHVLRS